jgi:hypothetical protein
MTVHLPYDYSRCANKTCQLRDRCKRALAPGRPGGEQTFSMFPGGEDCEAFIDVNERSTKDRRTP